MPKLSSAQKIARSAERKHRINQPIKTRVKNLISMAESAIASGNRESAAEAVKKAVAALDSAKTKGVLHPNNVARRKSRLVNKYNQAFATKPAVPDKLEQEESRPQKPPPLSAH
jgi:small subunit ribosomal protein S20